MLPGSICAKMHRRNRGERLRESVLKNNRSSLERLVSKQVGRSIYVLNLTEVPEVLRYSRQPRISMSLHDMSLCTLGSAIVEKLRVIQGESIDRICTARLCL